jgi:hypothetical protein
MQQHFGGEGRLSGQGRQQASALGVANGDHTVAQPAYRTSAKLPIHLLEGMDVRVNNHSVMTFR